MNGWVEGLNASAEHLRSLGDVRHIPTPSKPSDDLQDLIHPLNGDASFANLFGRSSRPQETNTDLA